MLKTVKAETWNTSMDPNLTKSSQAIQTNFSI